MKSFLLFLFLAIALNGCLARSHIVDYPHVSVRTNLPLSYQGVVVVNAEHETPITLTIVKTGRFGQSIRVRGMPAGESFFVPADGFVTSQTFTITVNAYNARGNLVGSETRPFSFTNSGYNSRNQYWSVRLSDFR